MKHQQIHSTNDDYIHLDTLKSIFFHQLNYVLVKDTKTATRRDIFSAAVLTVKEYIAQQWLQTQHNYYQQDVKRVYYISMEFLMGRSLKNHMDNLGLTEAFISLFNELEYDLEHCMTLEEDAGLGNGGLGRLAACFMDSMATLGIPGYGYGICYKYGIFSQKIENGEQVEYPDNWLRYGNPWELCCGEFLYPVYFYGKTTVINTPQGKTIRQWVDYEEVQAMPYDMPVPGFRNKIVNTLRLWQAISSDGFNLNSFNQGDYLQSIKDLAAVENISWILYPNDNFSQGKELRLKQEYFLVSATIQDILRRFTQTHLDLNILQDKIAIQLNDTHPALGIAEMMRLLVDSEELSWEKSWQITTKVFNYTNHTILPEALERWTEDLFKKVLPRHLEIIQEINRRWLKQVAIHYPDNDQKLKALSIMEKGEYESMVNMARLAIVGSAKVNGVSKLHSNLLKERVFQDFQEIFPNKFINKTNGITPRRWLKQCNPKAASLISLRIGEDWLYQSSKLALLRNHISDHSFVSEWDLVKRNNKQILAQIIKQDTGIIVDPASLFDCHVKRIHEYKRQLLNILSVANSYVKIKEKGERPLIARTVIFGGKAAPGYILAKQIIAFITSIAQVINNDPEVSDCLKVIFLPDYRVSLAEKIIPAADLSQQISTAGLEASGTGNMKFSLNGALTIGTWDGANIEMAEEIGKDKMFIFGLKEDEIAKKQSSYNPVELLKTDIELSHLLQLISEGYFNEANKELFKPLLKRLTVHGDQYFIVADFNDYQNKQKEVERLFLDKILWNQWSLLNVAGSSFFSSDRTIYEYASEIWGVNGLTDRTGLSKPFKGFGVNQ
ncbi:Glycogen phosphorylase [Candidatus Clavichlamydia salmonicola]|uniref:glycogen/starch/alpha-glucan phosphorylase n=1 Tax=Candidatus Clavichlamydia salmonicola TaxID=469812 RepID=UPI001891BF5E|nr:glycogen/starch/alpha-glucan phosphorylase [Candidatus Clavichlamydia salmonicola]MBF5050784.1 Glycogen phosphorylase [Candidatus Clavichlamydia salmonicola]